MSFEDIDNFMDALPYEGVEYILKKYITVELATNGDIEVGLYAGDTESEFHHESIRNIKWSSLFNHPINI